jgi:hypothetical protein
VYGEQFPVEQSNLFKYFVKILGCDLIDNGYSIPSDLITLLKQKTFHTGLKISFSVNENLLHLVTPSQRPVGIGNLITTRKNIESKNDPAYIFNIYFSFLHVNFWYLTVPDGSLGSPWIADARYLYLGYIKQLELEQE